jgi:hypothetical protein
LTTANGAVEHGAVDQRAMIVTGHFIAGGGFGSRTFYEDLLL